MREADLETVRSALLAASDAVVAAQDRLTKADQAIGDGDHGVGMARGFRAARSAVEQTQASTVGDLYKAVGMAILSGSGGASGAIFGTFFISSASALGTPALDAAGYAASLDAALAGVRKRGGAEPGDKTVVDALAPAALAARNSDGDLAASTGAAASAAEQGVEASRSMVARFGKAKTLGDRSIGHPDPGAITLAVVLRSLATSFQAG
jgi:phosphoenolpyruvate---glycerone phosphotransferase subunit DhaL